MSHYDCSNCGAYLGIDFGYCKECTPKEYFKIKEEIEYIKKTAQYNDPVYMKMKQDMEEYLASKIKHLQDKLTDFEEENKRKQCELWEMSRSQ